MAGSLQLFQIEVRDVGEVTGYRLFDDPDRPYEVYIAGTGDVWRLSANDARNLGRALERLDHKLVWFAKYGGGVEFGSVFCMRHIEDGRLIIDIGVTDDGRSVFLELFAIPRVELDGEEQDLFMRALHRLAEDSCLLRGAARPRSGLAR